MSRGLGSTESGSIESGSSESSSTSDRLRQKDAPVRDHDAPLFSTPKAEPVRRGPLFGAIAAALLVAAICAAMLVHRSPKSTGPLNTLLPPDAYSANLTFTQLAMSESESLSGGKSTFMDGHVRNTGSDTLTSVTMQVVFKNDEGVSPAVVSLPLSIIRTHEPYVDTEAVSAAPLKPGDEAEFRLIFETVPSNWNQQMPDLRVVQVAKR